MTTRIEPPGLPSFVDEQISPVIESTWDALARAAMEIHCISHYERARVHWLHYAYWHWCCWRRMRVGRIETQPVEVTFGWSTDSCSKFAACRRCGRIKEYLL